MAPSDLGEDPREQVGRGARLVLSRHPWCGVNAAQKVVRTSYKSPTSEEDRKASPRWSPFIVPTSHSARREKPRPYLLCLAYFPLTWPLPSQPGVGQLQEERMGHSGATWTGGKRGTQTDRQVWKLGGGGWGAGPGSPGRAKALSLLRRMVSDRRWGASCPLSEQDTCPSCSLT